jgi:hypothetical protein
MNDIDTDLIVDALRKNGHTVEHVYSVPDNAGVYEFIVDGNALNLDEVRELLEQEASK